MSTFCMLMSLITLLEAEQPAEWVYSPGQAPIATYPFRLPRLIYLPSGRRSRFSGVLADQRVVITDEFIFRRYMKGSSRVKASTKYNNVKHQIDNVRQEGLLAPYSGIRPQNS